MESVFDHEEDCSTAHRIAERQLERLRNNLGTPWETEKTEEWIEKYEEFISND